MTDSTNRPARRTALGPLAALALALLVMVTSFAALPVAVGQPAAPRAAARSLSVSPSTYVGGQALTWTGNVGHPGVRRLGLQKFLGRPGDSWLDVDGFSAHTRANGSFTFVYPAPDMIGVFFRVKAGSYVTPAKTFSAKAVDLTIRLTGTHKGDDPGMLDDGQVFGITVDTTPDDIFHLQTTDGLPIFKGRKLTLQRRVDGNAWSTVATTTVDTLGFGSFPGLTEPAGVAVYRVREEDVSGGGNQIGWTQSFPLYLYVGPDAQAQHQADLARPDGTPVKPAGTTVHGASPTAAMTYRWTPSIWDFAWETGESLTSPPARGTSHAGWWQDYSDGTGRVIRRGGALLIDSKRHDAAGPGDVGTTSVTLQKQSATQGRWETRLHLRNAAERGGNDYAALAELVPARAADYDCGAHNITIADLSAFSKAFQFGVRSPDQQWRRTASASSDPVAGWHNFAVEVAAGHITWFADGKPVGSVTAPEALSGVPMTLRLSLAGDGQDEMDQLSLISDWQRGYPIDRGRQVVSKVRLTGQPAAAATC